MKASIVSGLALAFVVGAVEASIAGPAAGPAFGTRSREALERNLEQQRPYQLTGTQADEMKWCRERRPLVSTGKRESAFVYVRSENC